MLRAEAGLKTHGDEHFVAVLFHYVIDSMGPHKACMHSMSAVLVCETSQVLPESMLQVGVKQLMKALIVYSL